MIAIFNKISERLNKYGSKFNLNVDTTHNLKIKILRNRKRIILLPDSEFLRKWNVVIGVILLYVALYVPYNICFSETVLSNEHKGHPITWYIDLIVDLLFFIDIPINFLTAYYDPSTNLPVVDFKSIAKNYIGSWFFIDVVTVLPIDMI